MTGAGAAAEPGHYAEARETGFLPGCDGGDEVAALPRAEACVWRSERPVSFCARGGRSDPVNPVTPVTLPQGGREGALRGAAGRGSGSLNSQVTGW